MTTYAAIKLCLVTALCITGPTGAQAAIHTVQLINNRFNPAQLTINVGDTVKWMAVNGGHDVESDVPLFKSPPPPISTYEFTFTQAGKFTYHCNPHASLGMRGTITVEAAANQPPTVAITSPVEGASFTASDSVVIQAEANDPDGTVTKVDFFANGSLVGTAAGAPFTTSLQGLRPGNYALTAAATDNTGASTTSATVNITVAVVVNNPPTVTLTSPSAGATFVAPASFVMTAEANDADSGLSKVEFFANDNLVGTATTAPFTVTVNNLAPGNYALTAKATDNLGAGATSIPVNVVVTEAPVNVPPTAAIVAPAAGLLLAAPATLNLEATAADTDGAVTEVAFFRALNHGGPAPDCCTLEPLGAVTASPYKLTLSDLTPGFYHLVAQATDDQGAKTISSEVVVTVYTPFKIESVARGNGETILRVTDSIVPGAFTLSAQASTDLQNWSDLNGTFTSVPGGLLEFKETSSDSARFYRVHAAFLEVPPAD